jgi:hypothetical protein
MRSKPALHDLMSAVLGSWAASVLLLPAEVCWEYMVVLLLLLLLPLLEEDLW